MSCSYAEGLSEYWDKGKLGLPEQFDTQPEIRAKVDLLTDWIRQAKHVVVHTGAGISTSAGIPDFRGPRGVWTLERKGEKPDMNVSWDDAQPTPTHMALAKLVEVGRVKFIITQNIDGLHLRSGVPRHNIAELHGNMFTAQCDKCRVMIVRDSPAPTVGQKYCGGDCPASRPNGRNCRGKLKDFVLDWEDELPDCDLSLSDSHSMLADLSIVMGSTLQIIPAGNMPTYTKKYQDGRLVICNLQPTKQDKKADMSIHTYVDRVMEGVMARLGLEIPQYDRECDPVKLVNRKDFPSGQLYLDWTQQEDTGKAMKKEADVVHDEWLRRRKEERKRKSSLLLEVKQTKMTKKIEVKEEEVSEDKPEIMNGSSETKEEVSKKGRERRCKKNDSYLDTREDKEPMIQQRSVGRSCKKTDSYKFEDPDEKVKEDEPTSESGSEEGSEEDEEHNEHLDGEERQETHESDESLQEETKNGEHDSS